jgi:hypothetical protein
MGTKSKKLAVDAVRRAERLLDGPGALRALEAYFSGRYTGAWFDAAGRPTDAATGAPVDPIPNRLTVEDLLSLGLLDVGLRTDTMIALLEHNADVAHRLMRIDRDLHLADAPDPSHDGEGPWVAANQLWKLLREVPAVGRTRASKLIARKRPHLIPIYDRHVVHGLGAAKSDNYWAIVQHVVQTHRLRLAELHTDLLAAHPDDGTIRALSELRVLDIVIWMRVHGARESDPDILLDPASA